MEALYFPKEVYLEAHEAYLLETGINPQLAFDYCMSHMDFFIEIAFSYVEQTPWPVMESV